MATQFDLPPEKIKLLEENAKRKTQLRNEFLKKASDPFKHGDGGTVFDPAFYRYQAMRVSAYEFFKPASKTVAFAILGVIAPIGGYAWMLYSTRAKQESLLRTGQIAYKDRNFKFV